jgi:hypothetical protein
LRSFGYDTPDKEDRLTYEYLMDMRARALKQLTDEYCANFLQSGEYDDYEKKKREFDDTDQHFTSRASAPLRASNLFMPSTDETTVLQAEEISWGDRGQKVKFAGRPSQSAPSISRLSCKCGYLELADKHSKMKQRWCVLKPTTLLYYYNTEQDASPKGIVDLECYSLVERVDTGYGVEAKAPWRFCVRAPGTMKQRGGKDKAMEKFNFECSEQHELESWIQMLHNEHHTNVRSQRDLYEQLQKELQHSVTPELKNYERREVSMERHITRERNVNASNEAQLEKLLSGLEQLMGGEEGLGSSTPASIPEDGVLEGNLFGGAVVPAPNLFGAPPAPPPTKKTSPSTGDTPIIARLVGGIQRLRTLMQEKDVQMAKTADAWRKQKEEEGDLQELKALLAERDGEVALLREREQALKKALGQQSEKLEAMSRKLDLAETERKIALVHAANSITRSRMMNKNRGSIFHAAGAAVATAALAAEAARAFATEAALSATAMVLANTGQAMSYTVEDRELQEAKTRAVAAAQAAAKGAVSAFAASAAATRTAEATGRMVVELDTLKVVLQMPVASTAASAVEPQAAEPALQFDMFSGLREEGAADGAGGGEQPGANMFAGLLAGGDGGGGGEPPMSMFSGLLEPGSSDADQAGGMFAGLLDPNSASAAEQSAGGSMFAGLLAEGGTDSAGDQPGNMFSELLEEEQGMANARADGGMFAGLLNQGAAGGTGESTFVEVNEDDERERGLVSMVPSDPSPTDARPKTSPALTSVDVGAEKEKTSVFNIGGAGSFLQRMSSTSTIADPVGAAIDEPAGSYGGASQAQLSNEAVAKTVATPAAPAEPPSESVWDKMRAAGRAATTKIAAEVQAAAADIQQLTSEDGPNPAAEQQQQGSNLFGAMAGRGVTFAMSPTKGGQREDEALQSPSPQMPSLSGDLAGLDGASPMRARQASGDGGELVEVVYSTSGKL